MISKDEAEQLVKEAEEADDRLLLEARGIARAALQERFRLKVRDDPKTRAFDLVRGIMDFHPNGWRRKLGKKLERSEAVLDRVQGACEAASTYASLREAAANKDQILLQRAHAKFGKHVFELMWNNDVGLADLRREVAQAKTRMESSPEKRPEETPPLLSREDRSIVFCDEVAAAIVTALENCFSSMPTSSELTGVVKCFPRALKLECYGSRTSQRFFYELPARIEEILIASRAGKEFTATGVLKETEGLLGSEPAFERRFYGEIDRLQIREFFR
jgi:hypothetical protein